MLALVVLCKQLLDEDQALAKYLSSVSLEEEIVYRKQRESRFESAFMSVTTSNYLGSIYSFPFHVI